MNKLFFLIIPLLLSGFTHLWNPVGYPDIFFDEGIYMRRAVNFLDTGNPQESFLYDHPYFGQTTIASILALTNYSDLNPPTDPDSLKSLYMIPRIFMGLLAVLDTFLIYMIVKVKYGRDSAFLSSILFAVLPFTWIFKRILLDSILLPLVLGAILLAIYSGKVKQNKLLIVCSGILLGLAVFTKIPAFTMIFVVAWIVYTNRKKVSDVLLLLIPFLLIPMMWPVNAIMLDQFDLWEKDMLWQSHRSNSILGITEFFLIVDPIMFIFGMSGIGFALIRRDKFLLLWFIPFVIFLSLFGYKQYFHWIMVIPVLCVAAGILLVSIHKSNKLKKKIISIGIISTILTFSFISTTILIINDISETQFEALSYVLENYDDSYTVLASPVYSWVLEDVYERKNTPKDYSEILFYPITNEKRVIIVDSHYRIDLGRGPQLQEALDNSILVKTFEGRVRDFDSRHYPYTSMQSNYEASKIEIHTQIRGQ